ncbi:MAG: anaerobic carbon-monoxide dehydrogenase catalytic subunit [Spirochaetales bacterium]|nr:anaerobic carbon-monoxide dehydrogenase catalytic subunit [Spirochaetales bacterium]
MARELKYADKATQQMVQVAEVQNIPTVWDRYDAMQPQCGFGTLGLCCRHCSMGPCRIDPFGDGPKTGICGATADTIAARHLVRMIAAGAAAHSDHGRDIAHTLYMVGQNPDGDYQVRSPEKLRAVAEEVYGIKTEGKDLVALAGEVAEAALNEFGQQHGTLKMAATAPPARQKLWNEFGIFPRAVDREIVEIMHRTHIGVDAEYKNVIKQGLRACLGDGWGGSMIATEISDVLFGSPNPLRAIANLGILKEDHVNVIVHGHEPTLSDIIAVVSQDEEMVKKAQAKGAKGIQLGGICCTAIEILMRHGVSVAGSFLQQELALMTGVVDMMVVDVQCIMPGLANTAKHFHTKLITTSPKAKMPGFDHVEFHEEKAVETAKMMLETAIDNYSNRNGKKFVPGVSTGLVAGFSTENVFRFLGGKYRSTYRPLNDAIIAGRLRGAAGVVGCSNPNVDYEQGHLQMVKELLANDVLVVSTGCNAITCGKHDLMQPEAAFKCSGKGLQEVCQAVGIPPVLHLGSCVDNSRILRVLANVVAEGGLGDDISELPVAGAAPEWMSEKAVSIGFYFVASGVYTVLCRPLPVVGAPNLYKYLTDEMEKDVGGKWAFEADPIEAARLMIRHIDKKRKALKLKPMMYPQPFPPEE